MEQLHAAALGSGIVVGVLTPLQLLSYWGEELLENEGANEKVIDLSLRWHDYESSKEAIINSVRTS